MSNAEWIIAVCCFVLAAVSAVISGRQFAGKGFLFNNAYLYASEEERRRMDKKPYYRQSAIEFCLISAALLIFGTAIILRSRTLRSVAILLIVGAGIYAVASSAKIKKRKKG